MPPPTSRPPPPHTEVTYSQFGNRVLIPEPVVKLALESGWAIYPVERATSLAQHNQLLLRRPLSFVVGEIDPDMMSLVAATGVTTAHFPPLVITHDAPLEPAHVETLRRAGVAALLDRSSPTADMVSVLRELARSWTWTRYALERVDIAVAIQASTSVDDTCMLSIACPHVKPLMSEPWTAMSPCRADRCTGWIGRIYVRRGKVVFAETPQGSGISALGQMMALRAGQLVRHEIFLWPKSLSTGVPLEHALLLAATTLDHRQAGREPPPHD